MIIVKPSQTNLNYLILIPPNIKGILTNFQGFDHNCGSIYVFPLPMFFGKFLLQNKSMCLANVKKAGPLKLRCGLYETDKLTYFDDKYSCVNSIWYLYCLSLEGKYLKRICGLSSWLITLKIQQKLNFRINDHLEFAIIVCQRYLSQALCCQKSLLLWIKKHVNWRTWRTLY